MLGTSSEGDMEARNKLIEHNLRLVAHIIKKSIICLTARPGGSAPIGTIGLIKAINTYRPNAGRALRLIRQDALKMKSSCISEHCGGRRGRSLPSRSKTDRDGSSLALMDAISCEEDLAEQLDARDDRSRIYQSIFSVLDDRERQIIAMRYGILVSPRR